MTTDQLDRNLNIIIAQMMLYKNSYSKNFTWFLSFGSMLNIVRDDCSIKGDLDISFIGDFPQLQHFQSYMTQFGFDCVNKVIFPDGRLAKLSLINQDKQLYGNEVLDFFFWFRAGNYMYHTYDYFRENKKKGTGVLPKYMCKGTPAWMLDGKTFIITLPNMRYEIPVPRWYGSLLDYWYPNWRMPKEQFGIDSTSMSEAMVTCKDPYDLIKNPSKYNDQIENSKVEYEKIVNRTE